jgi:hypothetical protein
MKGGRMKRSQSVVWVLILALVTAFVMPLGTGFADPHPWNGMGTGWGTGACETTTTIFTTPTVTYPVVRITPCTINLKCKGSFAAHIRLDPDATATVETATVLITGIDTQTVSIEPTSVTIESTSDAIAKFPCSVLQGLVVKGRNTITLSFSTTDGTAYTVTGAVRIINPGKRGKPKHHGHAHASAHATTHAASHGSRGGGRRGRRHGRHG